MSRICHPIRCEGEQDFGQAVPAVVITRWRSKTGPTDAGPRDFCDRARWRGSHAMSVIYNEFGKSGIDHYFGEGT